MRKTLLTLALIVLAVMLLGACGTTSAEFKDPVLTLSRVQVQSYFDPPWAGWPAAPPTPTPPAPGTIRVPMILAFIWDINNPNDQNVTLEQMKFTVEFEAAPLKPNEYFALNTPIVYEQQTIPARATNQVRVVTVLDSAVIPGTLLVAYGNRIGSLGVTPAALVQNWWTKITDYGFGIKATAGTADFRSASGQTKVVAFEGKFPK